MEEKKQPSRYDIDRFDQATQAFTDGFKMDFVTFLRYLHEKGIDLNFAVSCIVIKNKQKQVWQKQLMDAQREWRQKALKCERCGKPMQLAFVNTTPQTQVGGKYNSQWYCPDQLGCGYTLFTKRTPQDWIKKLRLDKKIMIDGQHPYLKKNDVDYVVSSLENREA